MWVCRVLNDLLLVAALITLARCASLDAQPVDNSPCSDWSPCEVALVLDPDDPWDRVYGVEVETFWTSWVAIFDVLRWCKLAIFWKMGNPKNKHQE